MNYDRVVKSISREITSSAPPVAMIGIGAPGSGKSTLLNAVASELSVETINLDSIRNSLVAAGVGCGLVDGIQDQLQCEIAARMNQDKIALIDSTHCYAEDRLRTVAICRSLGARTVGAVVLDVPLEKAVLQNAGRTEGRITADTIRKMHEGLKSQPPSASEGYDWMVRHN